MFLTAPSKFSTKLAVYQYGTAAMRRGPELTNADCWVPVDAYSIQSILSTETRLARRFLQMLDRGFRGVFLLRRGRWISYVWVSEPGGADPPHLPE
jgi:hypothetical protein